MTRRYRYVSSAVLMALALVFQTGCPTAGVGVPNGDNNTNDNGAVDPNGNGEPPPPPEGTAREDAEEACQESVVGFEMRVDDLVLLIDGMRVEGRTKAEAAEFSDDACVGAPDEDACTHCFLTVVDFVYDN